MHCDTCQCDKAPKYSKRQQQILDAMSECDSYKTTAARLGIAVRTVKAHVNRMYLKSLQGSTRLKRIQIVVNEIYAQHPELVPFSNGDRAAQVNQMPAHQFAAQKINVREFQHSNKVRSNQSAVEPQIIQTPQFQQLTQLAANVVQECVR